MLKFNSISRMNFFSSLIIICLLTFSLAYYLLKSKYNDFLDQSKQQEMKLLEYQKQLLEHEVERSLSFIDYKKSLLRNRLNGDLKEKVDEIVSMADAIYQKNVGRRDINSIKNLVREAVRPLRYNKGEGYYFASSLDGIVQLYPIKPETENCNALNLQDSHGSYVMLDEIKVIKEKGEGFVTHYWTKPTNISLEPILKTSFIKLFAPFNWYFGTGKYLDDVENELQNEVLEYFRNIKFGKSADDCLMILEYSGFEQKPLSGRRKFMPVKIDVLEDGYSNSAADSLNSRYRQELNRQLTLFDRAFLKYKSNYSLHNAARTNIIFFKKYPEWNWIVGAVLDVSDLYQALNEAKEKMQKQLFQELISILLITIFFFLLTAVFSWMVSRSIEREFKVFANFFNSAANNSRMVSIASLDIKEFKSLAEALNLMIYKRDTAERRMIENEKTFRSFMDHADEFMIIKDLEGHYVVVNQKFKEILQLEYSEIIGKRPEDLGYEATEVEKMREKDRIVISSKRSIILEEKASKSKAAGIEWLEEIVFPIFDTENKIRYVGILSRNITERKRAEANIALQQEQLKKAYEELQQSQEFVIRQEKLASLGTMIAGIAHEINNPAQAIEFSLSGLQLNISDLQEIIFELRSLLALKDSEQVQALAKLRQALEIKQIDEIFQELTSVVKDNKNSVSRISQIIRSIKRLVHNNIELAECDINEIVNDSISLVKNQIKNQITIISELSENLPAFHGSAQEMGQVFINMLLNSCDAVVEKNLKKSEGFVKIITSFLPEEKMLRISVSDNGIGIKSEVVEKIFDPFLTTKAIGKGTGLGLYISYRIIENHYGKISVVSRFGEGTEFTILLPQKEPIQNSV